MINMYMARVINTDELSDTVDVLLHGGNMNLKGIRMLRSRSNPLYGVTGNLPDIGELGIIIHLPDYGNMYFWLGSYANQVENICTGEPGKILEQLQNGTWYRVAADGTTEISHPSGTKVIIGGTSLSSRTYQRRKSGKRSLNESRPYPQLQTAPQTLYIEHARKTVDPTFENFSEDKRKQTVTNAGTQKLTKFTLDDLGNMVIDHCTDADTHYTFSLDKDGNLDITIPGNRVVTIDGSDTVNSNVQINGNLDVSGNISAKYGVSDSFTDKSGKMMVFQNGILVDSE